MHEDAWNAACERFAELGATHLLSRIPREAYAAASGQDHPLAHLFDAAWTTPFPPVARLTDVALGRVASWLASSANRAPHAWWRQTCKDLGHGDPNRGAGALAEIRALGALLSNAGSLTGGLGVRSVRRRKDERTPDFVFGDEPAVFVEVICPRSHDAERQRQNQLDEIESTLLPQTAAAVRARLEESRAGETISAGATAAKSSDAGTVTRHSLQTSGVRTRECAATMVSVSSRLHAPWGPVNPRGLVHTIASAISGKKPPGQIPAGAPGVLWMDLCDPHWSLPCRAAEPATVFWMGMALATTHGIWHAFYGKKNATVMMERAAVELGTAEQLGAAFRQHFDGRFRNDQQRCWSAAVLRCTDGLVIFENPQADVPLPMPALRGLIALEGYAPTSSYHRVSKRGFDDLEQRLESVERQLAFYVGVDVV